MPSEMYVLIGTLAGAAIPGLWNFITTRASQKHEIDRLHAELGQKEKQDKRGQYARILGALWQEDVFIVEMVDCIRNRSGDWKTTLTSIVDDANRQEQLEIVNNGIGLIALECKDQRANNRMRALSRNHDEIVDMVIQLKEKSSNENAEAQEALGRLLDDWRNRIDELAGLLRADCHDACRSS